MGVTTARHCYRARLAHEAGRLAIIMLLSNYIVAPSDGGSFLIQLHSNHIVITSRFEQVDDNLVNELFDDLDDGDEEMGRF